MIRPVTPRDAAPPEDARSISQDLTQELSDIEGWQGDPAAHLQQIEASAPDLDPKARLFGKQRTQPGTVDQADFGVGERGDGIGCFAEGNGIEAKQVAPEMKAHDLPSPIFQQRPGKEPAARDDENVARLPVLGADDRPATIIARARGETVQRAAFLRTQVYISAEMFGQAAFAHPVRLPPCSWGSV